MSAYNCEWNFFLYLFSLLHRGSFRIRKDNCFVKICRTVHNINYLSAPEHSESGMIFEIRHMVQKLRGRRGRRGAENAAVFKTKNLEKNSYLKN